MSDLTNTGTAVVTGASSGIGRMYADRLAGRGFDLLLVARRRERLEALAAELRERDGVTVKVFVADLSDADDLERVASDIAGDDSITMLVNNAGTTRVKPLEEVTVDELRMQVDLNVTALSRLTMAALPGFKRRDRGTIINIGSAVSFHGFANNGIYSGSKAYVLNFTESLREELADTNIVVQLVAPAMTESEIAEVSGYDVSGLPDGVVMSVEHCVDAALAGLDAGEAITMPSVEDAALLANFQAAADALFHGSFSGKPASRYGLADKPAAT